jgi:hypothetical protein
MWSPECIIFAVGGGGAACGATAGVEGVGVVVSPRG